jgi:hypothetical protein
MERAKAASSDAVKGDIGALVRTSGKLLLIRGCVLLVSALVCEHVLSEGHEYKATRGTRHYENTRSSIGSDWYDMMRMWSWKLYVHRLY